MGKNDSLRVSSKRGIRAVPPVMPDLAEFQGTGLPMRLVVSGEVRTVQNECYACPGCSAVGVAYGGWETGAGVYLKHSS